MLLSEGNENMRAFKDVEGAIPAEDGDLVALVKDWLTKVEDLDVLAVNTRDLADGDDGIHPTDAGFRVMHDLLQPDPAKRPTYLPAEDPAPDDE